LTALSLADIAWRYQPQQHYWLRTWNDGRMDSRESRELAADLKSVGFRFVGPVVAHSFMQTVGIENGHFDGCFRAPRECAP
jgi:DNA-3-methyladenine glycosylase I